MSKRISLVVAVQSMRISKKTKTVVAKSLFAVACIVAASVIGFKAYVQHDKNMAANTLLAENVEALCQTDIGDDHKCNIPADPKSCWSNKKPADFQGISWTYTKKVDSYGSCMCVENSRSCPPGSSAR